MTHFCSVHVATKYVLLRNTIARSTLTCCVPRQSLSPILENSVDIVFAVSTYGARCIAPPDIEFLCLVHVPSAG
eukprot:scaffold7349_cov173-Amphora_coffeaeformis.AAC.118